MVPIISSFSPFLDSAPGFVIIAQDLVISAGSSTKQESGYLSSGSRIVTSTPQFFRASM